MTDDVSNDHLRPHCDTWICAKCRQPITKGHRVIQVLIAVGKDRNPTDFMEEGLSMAQEWEMAHINCNDPLLIKGLKT